MDSAELIGQVAKRHQVLLDPDDPVVLMATAVEVALEKPLEKIAALGESMTAAIEQVHPRVTDLQVAQIGERLVESVTDQIVSGIRTRAIVLALLALVGGVATTMGAGYWIGREVTQSELVAAPQIAEVMKAKDAALWVRFIKLNSLSDTKCTPVPQPKGGEACSMTLWTKLPSMSNAK